MKASKNLISALLGAALLAMPITAAAHPRDGGNGGRFNRGPAPAYCPVPAYRPIAPRAYFAPRANFAPRFTAPRAPIVQIHDHDDWRWRNHERWEHRDRDDWRWRDHDRDDRWRSRRENYRYRTVCDEDGDDCRQVPQVNNYYYRQGYRPNYYRPESYNYAPYNYGAPVGSGLQNLIRQRDSAVYQYRVAMSRGNHERAEHLANAITELNKRIANARTRRGYNAYNYSSFNSYEPYDYNNSAYGYQNADPLTSMVAPLLGNIY
jgi:hypothetical protein